MRFCFAAGFPLCAAMAVGAARSADQVFVNGAIYTQDPAQPWVEGFAIIDGRYIAVGANATVQAFVGLKTTVVDLKGRMVMSGLIDDHVHAVDGAMGELYDCIFASTSTPAQIRQIGVVRGCIEPLTMALGRDLIMRTRRKGPDAMRSRGLSVARFTLAAIGATTVEAAG
jgi:cytosine/adenosine deaminase-related metal-dependent hydrolase